MKTSTTEKHLKQQSIVKLEKLENDYFINWYSRATNFKQTIRAMSPEMSPKPRTTLITKVIH